MKFFFLFLISACVFGQKKYSFDYKISYDYKVTDASKSSEIFFYTNSKDNSYMLMIADRDSLNYELTFRDQNGIYFKSLFEKNKFDSIETFLLDCQLVKSYLNYYKYQTENYSFHNKEYALMDGEYHPFYILKSDDIKREKRRKLATFYYYIQNNTDFHLPILVHETAYEEWKLEKNIPNGIAKEMYYLGYAKTELYDVYKLKEIIKINKVIIIPKECDYTDPHAPRKLSLR